MNIYDEFLQHSAELAADMKQPPFPVVCQFGIYAFDVNGSYPAAVTVSGVGQVYARNFKAWAGQALPDCNEFIEPSAAQLVAMLEAQKR